MKLLFWKKDGEDGADDAQAIPADLQPYYAAEPSRTRRILTLVAGIVIGLIVLALLFLAGRWAVHKVSKKDDNTLTTTTQTTPSTSSTNTQNQGTKAQTTPPATEPSTPNSSNSAQNSTTTPSTDGSASTTQPSDADLANTGPGDVVILFAVAVVAGAIAHNVFVSKRLQLKR